MLIDLETAKETLRITHDDEDLKVQREAEMAEQIVVDYIKRPDHGWTAHTVPLHVQAAMVHVLHRIHDDPMGELEGGWLSPAAKDLLHRERDPALA
ncbi:phage gp6-like head-tail connector protein [Paracoccus suum]|uniref:Phage gp6-like head-tail connector protein n=1 Tax=Paracoccus suum TaxID=2259340 RepID=A0A344PL04_9RHOB|nr:head-tail connector protein [Paracoccus suum]AXC50059.1 phage gp6-like head-tail connector protein [Paracoccus suum]